MANTWDDILVERLRYYIYDLDSSNYSWTDLQLQKFLAISAIDVFGQLIEYTDEIGGSFTINTSLSGPSMISPDPVSTCPAIVTNMIVTRAACLISQQEYKKLLGQGAGWKVVDDRSTIDGTSALEATKNQADYYCQGYSEMLMDFKKNYQFIGSAILSPYTKGLYPRFPRSYGRFNDFTG